MRIVRVLFAMLLVSVPFAGALVALRYAPPAYVDIAGQQVSVKPVIGQDTSRLQHGAVIRPEHTHVAILNKDIGVDIDADWNKLIPSDKPTRRYLTALWDDPDPEIDRINSAARDYVVRWSIVGFGSGAAAVAGFLLVLHQRRRKLSGYPAQDARLVRDHNRRLRWTAGGLGIALIVALDTAAAQTYLHADHHVVASSPVFLGTTLEGTEVNGLIGDILPFLSILQPRSTFYDTAAKNLEKAIAAEPGLQKSSSEPTFVVAEDFEDVNGMARQVGLAAHLIGADFIALSGDLTFAGKTIESYIIDTVNYYSDNLPVYFAPGLHDTPEIVQAASERGWHVADGKTHNIHGVTLLAAGDPRISTVGDFGTGDVLRDPAVDTNTFVADTIKQACDTHPDFVLLHDHTLGQRIAQAGCQGQAVLDGRSYQFVGPQIASTASGRTSIEFTSGSGGGHVSTAPDPGTISHPAQFVAVRFSPDTGETHYFVFTVQPDATVTVTPAINLNVAYRDFRATGRTEPAPGQAPAQAGAAGHRTSSGSAAAARRTSRVKRDRS